MIDHDDPYLLYTSCHRSYVRGMRFGITDRLMEAFGDDWWEHGVLSALSEEQRENLCKDTEKLQKYDDSRVELLDASHFQRVMLGRNNHVFADAFPDAARSSRRLGQLVRLRNEWAHVQDMSLARTLQAADLMRELLTALGRREALEVKDMIDAFAAEPRHDLSDGLADAHDASGGSLHSPDGALEPDGFWGRLQSYLVVQQTIEGPQGPDNDRATVTVSVRNSAPNAHDLPIVRFSEIEVRSNDGNSQHLGELEPGETREATFSLRMKKLIEVEFQIDWAVDADTLFRFTKRSSPTDSSVDSLREQFLDRLNSEGVEAFLAGILKKIGEPSADMPLSELSRLRASLAEESQAVEQKREALAAIGNEFSLSRESTLGCRMREVILLLVKFGEMLSAMGEAIGSTDIKAIKEAVGQLEDVQVAVLRVQDTVRAAASSE